MKNISIIILGISASLFLTACGNPLDILGPRNKPPIINDDWKSIVYKYNFRVSETKTIRKKISITDKAQLDEIKKLFIVKKYGGLSIGIAGEEIMLTTDNGEVWEGAFVFEDKVFFCKVSDRWYSYYIELNDYEFNKALRKIAVEKEKLNYPKITWRHIFLRRDMSETAYPIVNSK